MYFKKVNYLTHRPEHPSYRPQGDEARAAVLLQQYSSDPQRYRFDSESPVSEAIIELEGAMNEVALS